MSQPVPGHTVQTPFHRRGKFWKTCKVKTAPNGKKTGLHTGVDIPAPQGTPVVAARAGVTKHVDFGPAFGTKQLAVLCDDGTEDFYAHMSSRKPGGRKVKAGDKIGEVGNSSSTPDLKPHLHFERHKKHAAN
jgi:murein DD-endopeptidase MepM/ murein hydrolase activator NlpD